MYVSMYVSVTELTNLCDLAPKLLIVSAMDLGWGSSPIRLISTSVEVWVYSSIFGVCFWWNHWASSK